MARPATLHRLEIDLSDSVREVWERISLRVARHPSESDGFFGARLLAYGLSWAPGLEFGDDLSSHEGPALALRDEGGAIARWIDVGTPGARRLNSATRQSPEVAVFCHKDPTRWRKELTSERVHAPQRVEVWRLEPSLASAIGECLGRRGEWTVMHDPGAVQVFTNSGQQLAGDVRVTTLEALLAG